MNKPLNHILEKLSPKIGECADLLKKAVLENEPIFLKYNDDVDGIAAALLIWGALKKFAEKNSVAFFKSNLVSTQTSNPIYLKEEALKDLQEARNFDEKPLLVLCDYGANEESIEGVSAVNAAGIKIVVIDHHPPAKEISSLALLVSPFSVGGSSDYTTGLVAFEVAKKVAGEADASLAAYSLQGDKSAFAEKKHFLEPVAIDFIASVEENPSLEKYEKIIADKEKIKILYKKAMASIERILKQCELHSKIRELPGGIKLVLVKITKMVKKGDYPPKGKALNFIQEKFLRKLGAGLVSIGYGEDSINVRADAVAFERGFRSSELIKTLKEEMGYAIVSGGGHEQAASIRIRAEFSEKVLEKCIETIERMFG
jgi:RecJ-like exonuclease